MSDNDTISTTSGWHLYDILTSGSTIWNGTAMVAISSNPTWTSCAQDRAEIGSTGFYPPPALTGLPAGSYTREVRRSVGGAGGELITDPVLFFDTDFGWDGTEEAEVVDPDDEDLTTTARYKIWAGISASTWDTKIGYLVTAVSKALLKYCDRDSFKSTSYTSQMHDNFGDGSFMVLRNVPVTAITSLVFYPESTNDAETYTGSNFRYEANTGEVRWDFDATTTEPFPRTYRAVSATYTAGHASVPADLELLAWQAIDYYYNRAGTASSSSAGLKREKIGDYEYENFPTSSAVVLADLRGNPAFEDIRTSLIAGHYYRLHWN